VRKRICAIERLKHVARSHFAHVLNSVGKRIYAIERLKQTEDAQKQQLVTVGKRIYAIERLKPLPLSYGCAGPDRRGKEDLRD